jgi:hypothetical protein
VSELKSDDLRKLATEWLDRSEVYRAADRYSVPGAVFAECALALREVLDAHESKPVAWKFVIWFTGANKGIGFRSRDWPTSFDLRSSAEIYLEGIVGQHPSLAEDYEVRAVPCG